VLGNTRANTTFINLATTESFSFKWSGVGLGGSATIVLCPIMLRGLSPWSF